MTIMPNKLRVFNSHDEAAAYEAVTAASQSPATRIKEAVELILRVYNVSRQDLHSRQRNNRITVIEYDGQKWR